MQVMNLIEICYEDADVLVCVKPPRVLSTDEPGGLPSLLRQTLGEPEADIRTVHRLDRVVGGLMVLARNPRAASELSRQVREGNSIGRCSTARRNGRRIPFVTFWAGTRPEK